jgi:hypothetical protein
MVVYYHYKVVFKLRSLPFDPKLAPNCRSNLYRYGSHFKLNQTINLT